MMLPRAAARSLNLARNRAPLQAILIQQSRFYAKNNKARKQLDYQPPSSASQANRHGPNAQRSTPAGTSTRPVDGLAATPTTKNPNPHPDYSELQDEFETSSSSDRNTAPQDTSSSAINPAETQRREAGSVPPLPDLTKGIPSTIESELANSTLSQKSESTSLNITEDPSQTSSGGRGGRDLPKNAYSTSLDRRRVRIANWLYASFGLLSITGTIYLGRDWENLEEEQKHPDAPSGWGFGLFYNRAKTRLADMLDYYNEPAFPKLLPNPEPAWERRYTLVLSLEDLLVHSEWSREYGWRMAKRPGMDYFLRYLSQYYEIVLFTSVPSAIAEPIVKKLDPLRIAIMWPLFREATRYKDGEYIKDLSYLNRDLKRVILMDTVEAHAKYQKENAIILPKWQGNSQDSGLIDFIPFLEYLATMEYDDTRAVLKSFEGMHIPTEFAQRERLARERFQKQLAEDRAKRPRRSGLGFLGNALGMKPVTSGVEGSEQTLSEGFEKGKTLQDQIRERGQKQYELLEKEIRENGEKWLQEMAKEDEKAKEEQMKGMKTSLAGMFGGGGK